MSIGNAIAGVWWALHAAIDSGKPFRSDGDQWAAITEAMAALSEAAGIADESAADTDDDDRPTKCDDCGNLSGHDDAGTVCRACCRGIMRYCNAATTPTDGQHDGGRVTFTEWSAVMLARGVRGALTTARFIDSNSSIDDDWNSETTEAQKLADIDLFFDCHYLADPAAFRAAFGVRHG